jgi:tRNA (guanine9-N1)-methyltransferase
MTLVLAVHYSSSNHAGRPLFMTDRYRPQPFMSDDTKDKAPPSTDAPPAKRFRKHNLVVLPGPRIVMDMNWDHFMSDHIQRKVVSQVSMAYSFNKFSQKSLPMIFTSVHEPWRGLLQRVNAFQWRSDIVTMNEAPLLDIVPVSDLVYLTADTPNVLTELDPTKAYVVGCLLDHNSKKGVTRDFAAEHGIRMARLPIQEYVTMEGRVVLTINHVVEILVRVANGADWKKALLETIPQRKNPKEKVGASVLEDHPVEEQSSWSLFSSCAVA